MWAVQLPLPARDDSGALVTVLDLHAAALEFARSAFRHACLVSEWEPALAASADGVPPPLA